MSQRTVAVLLCWGAPILVGIGCGSGEPPPSNKGSAKKAEFTSRAGLVMIQFQHRDELACATFSRSSRCDDESHWAMLVNGDRATDPTRTQAFLKGETSKRFAETKVSAFSCVPYSVVQPALAMVAAAGTKTPELDQLKLPPDPDARPIEVAVGAGAAGGGQELVLLIGKQKPRETHPFRWVKMSELKGAVDAAAGQSNRKTLQVVLRPIGWATWGEVLETRTVCQSLGLERIEFAAP